MYFFDSVCHHPCSNTDATDKPAILAVTKMSYFGMAAADITADGKDGPLSSGGYKLATREVCSLVTEGLL